MTLLVRFPLAPLPSSLLTLLCAGPFPVQLARLPTANWAPLDTLRRPLSHEPTPDLDLAWPASIWLIYCGELRRLKQLSLAGNCLWPFNSAAHLRPFAARAVTLDLSARCSLLASCSALVSFPSRLVASSSCFLACCFFACCLLFSPLRALVSRSPKAQHKTDTVESGWN